MTYSNRWLSYFSDVAERTAQLSYATRLQVGVVAVKEKRIVLCGFNGTPIGFSNTCEDDSNITLPSVIHAEENLILFAAKTGISLLDCDLFCTHSACSSCAKMIISTGIKTFFFKTPYRDSSGLNLLRTAGISVIQLQ